MYPSYIYCAALYRAVLYLPMYSCMYVHYRGLAHLVFAHFVLSRGCAVIPRVAVGSPGGCAISYTIQPGDYRYAHKIRGDGALGPILLSGLKRTHR